LSGCITARDYTPKESAAMIYAVTGQAADIASTAYGISGNECSEANPVFNWADNNTELLVVISAGKLLMIGGFFILGEFFPDSRTLMWGITGTVGYGASIWNLNQKHGWN